MKLSLKELSTLTLNPDTLRLAVQKVQMDGFVLFESVIPTRPHRDHPHCLPAKAGRAPRPRLFEPWNKSLSDAPAV